MEQLVKIEKAYCPTCKGERNCYQHGNIVKTWSLSDYDGNLMDGAFEHSLFECLGCETVFYEQTSTDSENIDIWHDRFGQMQGERIKTKTTFPKPPSRPKPKWTEDYDKIGLKLPSILEEIYNAYEANCFVLTVIGLRTALDCCFELLKIDTDLGFANKLTQLLSNHYVGQKEYDLLEVLIDAGNAAAHRGWNTEIKQIESLMEVLETFIKRVFINGELILSIKDTIPKRYQNPSRKNSVNDSKTVSEK